MVHIFGKCLEIAEPKSFCQPGANQFLLAGMQINSAVFVHHVADLAKVAFAQYDALCR